MFSNYFKTAWRNIIRSRGYSLLNILGLAIGMAVALVIGLWVVNEYSYDKFLPEHEQLYRVKRNFNSNGEILTFSTTSLKLAEALRNEVPEIEYVAESNWMGEEGLMVGDKKLYIRGGIVGGDFLKMFRYPLIEGNANVVLADPFSIVLTESTARSLFGDDDPMNKVVRFNNMHDLKVSGVLKDLPSNSSFKFNFLVPFSLLDRTEERIRNMRTGSYDNNGFQEFVKLKKGVSLEQVAPKIKYITRSEKTSSNAMLSEVFLQPVKNWHLYSEYQNGKEVEGFMKYVRMFSIIGILVLLIACINFVNLITARSEKRAKEVGVRKAIGSERKDLILQFLTESFLLTLIAFILAFLLVQISLSFFNALTGTLISIPFSSPGFWLVIVAGLILITLLAGSRPAFYLSSFNPVKVLKGLRSGNSASLGRQILVGLQYTCSVALIISTIIVYQQIQYVKDRPTGLTLDRLMITDLNKDLGEKFPELKNDMMQSGVVESVTVASSPATDIYWHSNIEAWPGKQAGETVEMGIVLVGDDYFKTMNFNFAEGRPFVGIADSTRVIFNEAAIKRLRIVDPINQIIQWGGEDYSITGVVKDALMISPYSAADPTMFVYTPGFPSMTLYRLAEGVNTSDAIAKLTPIFNKHNPAFPYVYTFTDETYAEKFREEILIGKLSAIFAGLAIFISCLGLFGLAAYSAERRTKEIGIRKVLGASISGITGLLFRGFLAPVAIATVIAIPIAFWAMSNWLDDYAYRINISPWVFLISALIAILIASITVSFQSIKAAMMNPVNSLKSE